MAERANSGVRRFIVDLYLLEYVLKAVGSAYHLAQCQIIISDFYEDRHTAKLFPQPINTQQT